MYVVVFQRTAITGDIMVFPEAVPVYAVQPVFGGDPYKACTVLEDLVYEAIGKLISGGIKPACLGTGNVLKSQDTDK
jgi:uncharacterized phosphosugar-binding protein